MLQSFERVELSLGTHLRGGGEREGGGVGRGGEGWGGVGRGPGGEREGGGTEEEWHIISCLPDSTHLVLWAGGNHRSCAHASL